MTPSVAVLYKRDGYDTGSKRLMGRQAAGEGFLQGLMRYGTASTIYCYAAQQPEFAEFCARVQPWMRQPKDLKWIPESNPPQLAQAGIFYRPDAGVADLAWQRRYFDQRGYSLCGLTHTIASKGALQMIGDLLTAPVQPWDALICTSEAVKTAVDSLLNHWADYLADRLGARPTTPVQLPVIPLGVDCERFQRNPEARDRLRHQLGIASEDLVVLYVGRLIFYAKAHPVPMYMALEQAAQAVSRKVHLIQAGWFEDEREEVGFKESARLFCPSVNVLFVDGRHPDIRQNIWSAADIFISLADNIQETFGLTPIEAMAAGLPVVVSDWNGYQETVRDRVDGFRIPTVTPPPGSGMEYAARYGIDALNYSTYIGHIAMMSAVEVNACAHALITLMTQPELRQKMGDSGRQRAQRVYDWKVVIAAYEALWTQLQEQRQAASTIAPVKVGAPPHPLWDDPFRQFAHYPTATLGPETVLQVSPLCTPEVLNQLQATWITSFGAEQRLAVPAIAQLVQRLAAEGPQSLQTIATWYADQHPVRLLATLGYLVKFNILERKETESQQ